MAERDAGRRPTDDGRPIPAIVNTTAGTAAAVLEALEQAGEFDVRECGGEAIGGLVRTAVAEGHRRVVVAGGDGSVGAAAAEVTGTSTELAILPAGTLNHFSRDHGIPGDIEEAIALARSGTARPTDVARVNGRVFLNTSSVGAYVSLVRIRERLEPTVGYSLGSLLAAVRVFFTVSRFVVAITDAAGQRNVRTPLLFIGVGERELKLPTLGGRVEDGRAGLHVMVVRGRTRGAIIALAFGAAFRGIRGMRTPHLETELVDRCEVQLHRHSAVSIDGELVHLQSPLRYEHLPGGLRLVRP